MPLIMISGYPASGKSTRAKQIRDFFDYKIAELSATNPRVSRLKVHIISDQSLGVSKEVYREARLEKDARATFYAAVKRLLSQDDVVIADGMNYIKGYRYQLHCEAKAVLTPSCVVFVGAPSEKCREWNAGLGLRIQKDDNSGADSVIGESLAEDLTNGEAYSPDILENLIFRYEEPNGMTRWDSPLFVVPWMDADVPGQDIWNAMVNNNAVKPHQATVLRPAAESNYLQVLDKITQDVVTIVLDHQKSHGDGGSIAGLSSNDQTIELPATHVGLPQLQRIRRQFISFNRQHTVEKGAIRNLFIEYLNRELEI